MKLLISIILDVLAVMVLLIPMIRGFTKGMKRLIFSMLSLAVSTVTAFAVSGIFAEPVYQRYFKEKVHTYCENAAENYDITAQTSDMLSQYGVEIPEEDIRSALSSAESLPKSISSLAAAYGADAESAAQLEKDVDKMLSVDIPAEIKSAMPQGMPSGSLTKGQIYDAARALARSPQEAADYAESEIAAPAATAVIKTVLFFLVQGLMSLIMLAAFFIFGVDFKSAPKTAGDRAGGAALGLVQGAASLLILVMVVGAAEQASGGLFDIESLSSKIFLPIFNILY